MAGLGADAGRGAVSDVAGEVLRITFARSGRQVCALNPSGNLDSVSTRGWRFEGRATRVTAVVVSHVAAYSDKNVKRIVGTVIVFL